MNSMHLFNDGVDCSHANIIIDRACIQLPQHSHYNLIPIHQNMNARGVKPNDNDNDNEHRK